MVIFTQHALLKLAQRNIKKEFVLKTLTAPDTTGVSYSGRQMAFKQFGRIHLKVVFQQEGENLIVLTQHWVEKYNQ